MIQVVTTLGLILQLVAPLNAVMHGDKVEIKDSPWTVAIVEESIYKLIGTGTILSDKWVLTAAKILYDDSGHVIYTKHSAAVLYGVSVIEYNDKGRLANIEEIFIHQQFKPEDSLYQYDYSLIKTLLPLDLTLGVAEAKSLVDKDVHQTAGKSCSLVGFGSTGDPTKDAVAPDRIRKVTVEIMRDDRCAKHTELLPGMICAGSESVGVCGGDAGAALICDDRLYAIFSHGMECVKNKFNVGYYTPVHDARLFISQATNGLIS